MKVDQKLKHINTDQQVLYTYQQFTNSSNIRQFSHLPFHPSLSTTHHHNERALYSSNDNNNVNTSIPLSQQKPPQLQPNQQLQQPPVNIMTANPLPGINLIQPLPNMMNQGISAIPFHTLNPAVNTLPQNQMNYAMNMNLNMQRFYYK
jgi:hypothetical protein